MKKQLISLILLISMLFMMIPTVFADGNSDELFAFDPIILDGKTETYIDDTTTQNQGGNGKPIGFVEGYGCGNSSLNDIVAFYNVDFGALGAKAFYMTFAYGKVYYGDQEEETTDLEVYLDDYESDPICYCQIGFTGGWGIEDAREFVYPVAIPSGVHNIFIKFTTGNSGSISQIHFTTQDAHIEDTTDIEYKGEPLADNTKMNIFEPSLKVAFINKTDTEVSFEDGNVILSAPTDTIDPYITLNIRKYYEIVKGTPVTADDYGYFVIKLRPSESITGNTFELFGCCDDVVDADYGNYVNTVYEANGEWQYIVFDFTMSPGWYGTINNIRLDWCTGCSEGAKVEIAEMCFFSDEDAAYTYPELSGDTTGNNGTSEVTTDPTGNTTASGTDEVTTDSDVVTTGATGSSDTVATTDAGNAAETAPSVTNGQNTTEQTPESEEKSGCGGIVGLFAFLAVVALGAVCVRKKF